MRRSKIYIVNAFILTIKNKTTYNSAFIKISKEVAKKMFDDFSEYGQIVFLKDEQDDKSLTFWASFWETEVDTGECEIKLKISEGNEQYPNPSITILKATNREVIVDLTGRTVIPKPINVQQQPKKDENPPVLEMPKVQAPPPPIEEPETLKPNNPVNVFDDMPF